MRVKEQRSRLMAVLALILALALIGGAVGPARAAYDDVAMFYEALAPYGIWVDYADYGPVWYPRGVSQDWRPYVNGRWVPTAAGWVFETDEAWAWACYHYGNWMPTPEYGWVWVPGSTWYPSTVAWRSSDEYVGWAPILPPNYVPAPAFYPPGGYFPGTPLLELLTAPFWIFAQAASFLLGFGQPFYPTYSYYNCGCLAPYSYVPALFPATFLLTDFYSPFYAPRAYYCFGPPFDFVSRVTRIRVVEIHHYVNTVNIINVRNVLPSREILARHPYIHEAIPEAVREGRRFQVERVADPRRVEGSLNRPDVLPRPRELPRLTAEIPKAKLAPREAGPEALKGIKGMGLPRQAEGKLTPQMEEKVRLHREQEVRRWKEAPGPPARAPKVPEVRPAPPEVIRPARPVPREEFQPPRPVPREELRPPPPPPPPAREFRPPPEPRPAPPREYRPPPAESRPAPPPERRVPPPERPAPKPHPERVD